MRVFYPDISAVSIIGKVEPGDQYLEFANPEVTTKTAKTMISHAVEGMLAFTNV